MLDWLASKVAMTVAAMLLLTAAAGFFAWEQADAARRSVAVVAEDLARFLDVVSALKGEATFAVSFGAGPGHVLPDRLDGSPYEIEIDRGAVIASRGSIFAFAVLGVPVHLFHPEGRSFSSADLARLDGDHPALHTTSSGSLKVERLAIEVDGVPTYATFVALPPS